jgi:hypothetical protein
MRPITTLCIHHSAGSSGSVDEFRREHMAKGWNDIGYHSVIGNGLGMPDGKCEPGRPDAVKGSAVWGRNTGLLHVCLVGDFTQRAPTRAQLDTLGEWLRHRSKAYGATKAVGHKELALPGHGTLCPGDLPLNKIRAWFSSGATIPLSVYLEAR